MGVRKKQSEPEASKTESEARGTCLAAGVAQADAFDAWSRGGEHGDRVSLLGPTVEQLACVAVDILGHYFVLATGRTGSWAQNKVCPPPNALQL